MPWDSPETSNSRRRFRVALTALAASVATMAAAVTGGRAAEQSFDCVIDPSETVKIGSPIAGILSEVLVGRGDKVARGQKIAVLESDVDVATVNLNRFKAESTARVDAQRERLAYAKTHYARTAELVARKVESQDSNKLDETRADMRVAEQELVREEQERKVNQLELARAEAALEQRTIRSTIDGIVTEKKLSAGEFINQDGYIAMLARLDPLFVEVYLPVATYKQVWVGMQATVQPAPPIGGRYAATVTVVDHVFDPSSNTFGARLALPNPDNRLPGGQRCKVVFDLGAERSDGVATAEPAARPHSE